MRNFSSADAICCRACPVEKVRVSGRLASSWSASSWKRISSFIWANSSSGVMDASAAAARNIAGADRQLLVVQHKPGAVGDILGDIVPVQINRIHFEFFGFPLTWLDSRIFQFQRRPAVRRIPWQASAPRCRHRDAVIAFGQSFGGEYACDLPRNLRYTYYSKLETMREVFGADFDQIVNFHRARFGIVCISVRIML